MALVSAVRGVRVCIMYEADVAWICGKLSRNSRSARGIEQKYTIVQTSTERCGVGAVCIEQFAF